MHPAPPQQSSAIQSALEDPGAHPVDPLPLSPADVQAQQAAEFQSNALVDLQHLLQALTHPELAAKPWAKGLLIRIHEALQLLEILRLTIAMNRPAGEVTTAAQHLLSELRLAEHMAQRSRADHLTKASVKMTVAIIQRLVASLKQYPPLSDSEAD